MMEDSRAVDIFSKSSPLTVQLSIVGDDGVGKRDLAKLLKILLKEIGAAVGANMDGSMSITTTNVIPVLHQPGTNSIVFLVYDICRPESFAHLKNSQRAVISTKDTYFIGNKIDLEYWRKVSVFEASYAAAVYFQIGHIEVSVLTGLHIDYLVDIIIRAMYPALYGSTAANDLIKTLKHISQIPVVEATVGEYDKEQGDSGVEEMDGDIPLVPFFPNPTSPGNNSAVYFIGIAALRASVESAEVVIIASCSHSETEADVATISRCISGFTDHMSTGVIYLLTVGPQLWHLTLGKRTSSLPVCPSQAIPSNHVR
jgi:hypothetical protein